VITRFLNAPDAGHCILIAVGSAEVSTGLLHWMEEAAVFGRETAASTALCAREQENYTTSLTKVGEHTHYDHATDTNSSRVAIRIILSFNIFYAFQRCRRWKTLKFRMLRFNENNLMTLNVFQCILSDSRHWNSDCWIQFKICQRLLVVCGPCWDLVAALD
jgi:hypothetical protein